MTARRRRARRFHHDIERKRTRHGSSGHRAGHRTRDGARAQAVKLAVYKHLLDINVGFDQVIRGLAALRKHDAFLARELDRFSALAKESRAATNSYLIGVMERNETQEAGRRFGKRGEREKRED